MRYEPEEFERLKDYVDEFMKRGPLGDIFTPFFYKPYPYNQTYSLFDEDKPKMFWIRSGLRMPGSCLLITYIRSAVQKALRLQGRQKA